MRKPLPTVVDDVMVRADGRDLVVREVGVASRRRRNHLIGVAGLGVSHRFAQNQSKESPNVELRQLLEVVEEGGADNFCDRSSCRENNKHKVAAPTASLE
uniref:Uncharacterized protein n=1 Tax=Bursaphelenchus xylophilus TaxID=6326 RepID=A0A1I7RW22_BURXY